MGFDKADGQPLVHLRRWGTKVNLVMVLGIIVFLGLGIFAIYWMHSHRKKAANDIQQNTEEKR
jgi:cbb3-type cytochrome oxidase subunit 3